MIQMKSINDLSRFSVFINYRCTITNIVKLLINDNECFFYKPLDCYERVKAFDKAILL